MSVPPYEPSSKSADNRCQAAVVRPARPRKWAGSRGKGRVADFYGSFAAQKELLADQPDASSAHLRQPTIEGALPRLGGPVAEMRSGHSISPET